MANNLIEQFPVWGLLPKKETGVTNFLTKYPEYDGRGITIAIFDSGVDPGAPGLQVTSEGKPKVIQRFDCSGAGDVDTTTVVKATNNVIQGLSGRQLKVPDDWKNPSGDFHIGVKNAFDLYPSKLKERVEEQRKEKLWESQHKTALADATRSLQEFEAKHPGVNLSIEDKLIKDDLEAQVSILNELDKKYSDIGPTFDCIVFHDGEMWRACLDTSETGQLANCKLLGEYSLTRDFTTIGDVDQFNFSINVHNNGNTLEIVGMCSGHGTHVACIASAYFPDSPEKNGIAPGAQIVSLTIGDARLGSMETGTGLVRAMIKVMELHSTNPIHVINMSYGEHAHWSNAGRIGELMNEVVNKYGVVWVVSAGNHGPALCTVGTPPDISQTGLIGVGAYVSPDMMIAEYSLRQRMPDMPFTWSSRSPTIDGDLGVTVCAPGAAITSVPNFTLRCSQLMNGTSMASPHVAGAIGILLSGMLNRNLPYSPYSVKRAIENSAQFIDSMDPFAQGRGLLRVERAFEHLATYCDSIERDVRFSILCANDSKGIHIRGGGLDKHKDLSVTVEPFFKDTDTTGAHAKINFSVKLALVSNAPYVQSPSHLDLMNMARAFSIRVDPSGLTPGVYLTTVDAYDVSCVEKGPLFRIPITIVKPIELDTKLVRPELEWDNVNFQPNTIQRHFIVVPELATWAVLRLKSLDKDKTGRFIVHCMQIQPKMSCKTLESQRLWNVTSQAENVHAFQVKSGLILEVVVAKYWANVGDINIQYSLSFHGVKPNNPCIVMHGGDGLLTVQLKSMRGEEIAPIVTLKNVVQPIRPVEAKITPLSSRDVIQPGRQIYELVLTYNFHVSKATEVVPNCPIFSDILYESEFESQMWFLFDTNKQVLATGDAYPCKYLVKLEKGDYTIKLQVRHDKKDLLEKYVDVLMLISQKLPSSISMDVYASQTQALLCGKKIMSAPVPSGVIVPIYIGPLSNDKASKGAVIGQYLSGTITYSKDEIGKKIDIYPFKYILPEPVKKNGVKPIQNSNTDKDKTKWEEYQDAIRDFKTNWLAKLEGCEEANTLYEELKTAHPEHFSIYTNMLQSFDPWDVKHQLPQINSDGVSETDTKHLNKIITIADIVINSINQEKLLAYFGLKSDNRPDATKIKSEMEKQRLALLDASARKGVALCKLWMQSNCASLVDQRTDYLVEISNVWNDLLKFTDMNENKVIFFAMWHANVYKNYGRLLKLLLKYSEEKSSREVDAKIVDVCMQLKWSHCARYFENAIPSKYPHAYRQF